MRIGIIGAGEIAVQTAVAIQACPLTELAGVLDVRANLARDLALRYGVPWTVDLAELLARPDIDAVSLAVPHDLHAPLTIQAAAAGKHVLCEKPIATTLEDADRMIDACREAGVCLDITYDAQTRPAMGTIRDLIAGGAIGRVIGAHMAELIDKPASYWSSGWSGRVTTDWRASKARSGGGVLLMNGSYNINTVRYLIGLEAERVYAEYGTFNQSDTGERRLPIEVEEYLVATIRYVGGAIGQIEVGSCLRGGEEVPSPHIRIYGTAGQIALSEQPRIYTTQAFEDLQPDQWQDIGVSFKHYAREPIVEGFAQAVLEGGSPPVTGEDARAVLEIVLAAYRSGEDGQPVVIGTTAGRTASR